MAKHNDTGAAFEQEVAALFRAAGYRVETHVQLGAKEYDIIASRAAFSGMDVRIAVECKYRARGGVKNTEANDFISAFLAARDTHCLTYGIMVANGGYSRTSQIGLREHAQIRFLTRSQLDDELLGARAFLENVQRGYRTDASNYIVLRATEHSERSSRTDDVAISCVDRLLDHKSSLTLLLGDFGSGKTTIAERVHRELAALYLAGKTSSFPLLLYLRTLDQSDSENNFIEQHLKVVSNQLGIQQLETLRKRGGLTFILDGYDEVATNAREDDRLRLTSRVMRLMNRADRILLTSRPTYFTSISELNHLVVQLIERDFAPPEDLARPRLRRNEQAHRKLARQFDIMRNSMVGEAYRTFSAQSATTYFINPLSRSDVIGYFRPHAALLKRKYNKTPEQVYAVLEGIYDITDLLTRPLLLQMFVVLLEEGGLDLGSGQDQIGPAGLYALYVNLHLNREWNLKKFLTSEERRAFARTLAVAILEAGGSLEATYEGLAAIVRTGEAAFAPARRWLLNVALADVVTDVRICAFINMTPSGRLEFSHKSFMEYFVAEVVINGLADRQPIPMLAKNLNYEILYFLGSFCITWSDYRLSLMNHLRDIGYSQSLIYRTNLKIALLFSEQHSREREYRDIDFAHVRVAKRSFERCDFIQVSLRNGQFFELHFSECQLDLHLEGEGNGLILEECSGGLTLPCQIEAAQLSKCRNLVLLGGETGRQRAKQISVENCEVALENAAFEWRDATLTRGSIHIGHEASLCLHDCKILGTKFSSDILAHVQLRITGGEINQAAFYGLHITLEDFLKRSSLFASSSGLIFVNDANQDADAFTWTDKEKTTRYRGYLVDHNLIFFDINFFERLPLGTRSEIHSLAHRGKPSENAIAKLIASSKSKMSPPQRGLR